MAKPEAKQPSRPDREQADQERDEWWREQVSRETQRGDPSNAYAQDALRRERDIEARARQEQDQEAKRIAELPEREQERVKRLAEARAIMARVSAEQAAEKLAPTNKPNLEAAFRIARRNGPEGPQWCAWVQSTTGISESTGWLPRARFLAEIVVLRKRFNGVLFDGVGQPHVWPVDGESA